MVVSLSSSSSSATFNVQKLYFDGSMYICTASAEHDHMHQTILHQGGAAYFCMQKFLTGLPGRIGRIGIFNDDCCRTDRDGRAVVKMGM